MEIELSMSCHERDHNVKLMSNTILYRCSYFSQVLKHNDPHTQEALRRSWDIYERMSLCKSSNFEKNKVQHSVILNIQASSDILNVKQSHALACFNPTSQQSYHRVESKYNVLTQCMEYCSMTCVPYKTPISTLKNLNRQKRWCARVASKVHTTFQQYLAIDGT